MINKIFTIAQNTFKEAIRNRILYSIFAFGILLIFSSLLLSNLSVWDQVKIIKDLGLSTILIFSLFISIFIGISFFYKEIDKKTIYTLISKPIPRYILILGKFCGIAFTVFVLMTFMFIIFMLTILFHSFEFDFSMLLAIASIYAEILIVIALALFFSSFSTPFLSGLFTISTYLIGHLLNDLVYYTEKSGIKILTFLADILYYVVPNMSNFDIRGRIVHKLYIDFSELIAIFGFCVTWVIILLFLSVLIFNRRDFK